MKKYFFIFSLILLLLNPMFSLETKEGKIKLVLNEETGRFTLFYLTDIKKSIYTPLFLADDPRTTVLSIAMGNKVYRMGESLDFRQKAFLTDTGATYIWKSAQLSVTEDFTFIKSLSSPITNGIKITISVENLSQQELDIGIRYFFDTYLGENAKAHFSTDTDEQITKETMYVSTGMPLYIVSKNTLKTDNDAGFLCMTKGQGITTPDRVILANWKRLNESSWNFDINTTRDFSLLPYSINDSALSLYFNQTKVKFSEKKIVNLVLGNYSKEGYALSGSEKDNSITQIYDQALDSNSKPKSDIDSMAKADLITVRDLLNKINQKIASQIPISDEELKLLQQVIDELNKRKNQYTAQ